jgi:4-carboxymuconolactone decarboxylase
VSHLLRELAILFIAVLNHAPYEWQQHEEPAVQAGATPEMLAALREKRTDAACFDDVQRATLRLTEEMTVAVKPRQETVARLKALLSTRELVELIGTISAYNGVARFLLATGIELE